MAKKSLTPPDRVARPPLARMQHLHAKLSQGTYPNCQEAAKELETQTSKLKIDVSTYLTDVQTA